jgi:hypothetical protein
MTQRRLGEHRENTFLGPSLKVDELHDEHQLGKADVAKLHARQQIQ